MAQTIQIVPRFSFPHIESYVNDYTQVANDEQVNAVDVSVIEAYAVRAPKGVDNRWIRKTNKADAIKTFGDSNFKKYGQPLMQALNVLDHNNSAVWMMRVMPENAAYSNAIVSILYKADTAADTPKASDRKFRIKLVAKSKENISTAKALATAAKGTEFTDADAETYKQLPLLTVRYSGRGDCGNFYSLRISQALTYEKEYGIKMYNFEVLTSEKGLVKDANYVGALVSSMKYTSEGSTLIDDVIDEVDIDKTPVIVRCNDETVQAVYDEYVKFIKQQNIDLKAQYQTDLTTYNIPADQLNGSQPVATEHKENYAKLMQLSELIAATDVDNIPDVDMFDPIYGRPVEATGEHLPCVYYPKKLTADVNTSAPGYNSNDYTNSTDLVTFDSIKGLVLKNGNNGYFDTPRTVQDDGGQSTTWTLEQEYEDALLKAYNGTHDRRILSPKRIPVTAFFDANYPYTVKNMIVDLAKTRNDCRVYLDTGIIPSFSNSIVKGLIKNYTVFDSHMVSVDVQNYEVREYSTNKKCNVTTSYFTSAEYVDHITENGMHIPFVRGNCTLTGHIKDSLQPIVEEYDNDLKERLYNNRLNYFECIGENLFYRAVQNTTQKAETDLLEESDSTILYTLKRLVERDTESQIYNFSDETVRKDFVAVEKAKYASWIGSIVQSLEFNFATSEYEFNHSILHLYLAVVFRGLTKKAIIEIDINKRQYVAPAETANE